MSRRSVSAVVAATAACLLAGCSGGAGDGAASKLSVRELADRLECDSTTERIPDPAEPVEPNEALDCLHGESVISIQTYASNADRDAVVSYLQQFSGFRAVGERWIVGADTAEAVRLAARKLDGKFVELRG